MYFNFIPDKYLSKDKHNEFKIWLSKIKASNQDIIYIYLAWCKTFSYKVTKEDIRFITHT